MTDRRPSRPSRRSWPYGSGKTGFGDQPLGRSMATLRRRAEIIRGSFHFQGTGTTPTSSLSERTGSQRTGARRPREASVFVLAAVSGASLARDSSSTATPRCRNVVRRSPRGHARPLGPGSLVGLLWIGFHSVSPAVRQRSAWLANACSTVVVAALATVLSARQRGAGRRLRKSTSTTNWSGQQGGLAFVHYR